KANPLNSSSNTTTNNVTIYTTTVSSNNSIVSSNEDGRKGRREGKGGNSPSHLEKKIGAKNEPQIKNSYSGGAPNTAPFPSSLPLEVESTGVTTVSLPEGYIPDSNPEPRNDRFDWLLSGLTEPTHSCGGCGQPMQGHPSGGTMLSCPTCYPDDWAPGRNAHF